MTVKNITDKERDEFNSIITHPLQSYEWGKFREKTGVKVIRRGFYENTKIVAGFQVTIHNIPHTSWTIGYVPKGTMPTKEIMEELIHIGKENKCVFIQIEPNIQKLHVSQCTFHINSTRQNKKYNICSSAHPLFTKYTFQLDLTKSEDELRKHLHSKTRYNIRIAQKHAVEVKEEYSPEAFKAYLQLTAITTKRQGFYAHTKKYHELLWETLKVKDVKREAKSPENKLTAHLLVAYYKNIALTTWILFVFHDTLYYPYGASSSFHRETMSSNLMMWEAIKYGKKLGLKNFDMWGSLGENPDPKNPWYGFHKFKTGYHPKLVEFIGSYDIVINPFGYQIYKLANKLRWLLLQRKK